MNMIIFSVYDSKGTVYARPFFAHNVGSAVRSFADIANDKTHPIGQHPEDYALYQIGEWDDSSCNFKLHEKRSLGTALEMVKTV